MLGRSRDCTGRGGRAESSGWAPRRTALAGCPAALGFVAMDCFPACSYGAWHCSAKMVASERRWEVDDTWWLL